MLTVVALEADAQGLPNAVEASQIPKASWLWGGLSLGFQ